jgi:hypothetical protein
MCKTHTAAVLAKGHGHCIEVPFSKLYSNIHLNKAICGTHVATLQTQGKVILEG